MLKNNITKTLNSIFVAEVLLVFVTFIWGSTFFITKSVIEIIPPFTFLSIRFIIASLMLFPFYIIGYKKRSFHIKETIFKGSYIGFFLWSFFSFQTIGLKYTSSTVAAFLTSFDVIFAPFLAALLLKSLIKKRVIIGGLIGIIGVFMISGIADQILSKNAISNISRTEMIGNTLILISAFLISLHILFTGKYAPNVDPIALLFVEVLMIAFLSILSMFFLEGGVIDYFNPLFWNSTVWVSLIVTVVFATCLAYFIQTYYQSKKLVTSSRVALIYAMEPVFAAILGYFFINEILNIIEIFGGILIIFALLITRLDQTLVNKN